MKKFEAATFAVALSVVLHACSPAETQSEETVEETTTEEVTEAEPTEPVSFTMDELSCWDLTTTEEEDQAFAATLVYGYVAGAAGANEQSSEAITTAIGTALEYCAENPDATAIEAFSQESE